MDALAALSEALEVMARDHQVLTDRVEQLQKGRAEGLSWKELLANEAPDNGTLELLSELLMQLTVASAQLRRSVVQDLRSDGADVATTAGLLGVSHQRGSYILRTKADRQSDPSAVG